MAKEQTAKPAVDVEVSAIGGDDFGAQFVQGLRLPGDGILRTRGGGDLGVYRELLTDWQIYSTFQQRRTAVISREWDVEPGGDDALSIAAAEHHKENLKALEWDRICKKSLMAIFEGFSPAELLYTVADNRFWIADVRVRAARRFRFGAGGELRMVTKSNREGIVMPDRKFWVFSAGAEDDDDPYGLGLGHYVYWPVWLKRNAIRKWSLFLETMAQGKLLARVPAGTKQEVVTKVKAAVSTLLGGGSAVMSDNVALDVLEGVRNSGGDFLEFCKYLDGSAAKVVLSQTMTTDDGSSLAQAQEHAGVKLDVIKTDADLQCESWNRGPARWMTEWNFPGAKPPRVYRKVEEEEDLTANAERDKVIYEMGFSPTLEYITERYGPGFAARTPAGSAGADTPEFAEVALDGESDDIVRSAVTGDEWRPVMSPIVDELEALADDCSTAEEFRDRLGEVAAKNPDALREGLARMMFSGAVAGQVGQEIDHD